MSHSVEQVEWASGEWVDSRVVPGVRFAVAKISLARRAEISRRMRGLMSELEFQSAGTGLTDRLAATEMEARIDRVYIEWGLLEVTGLVIDGATATVESVVERGPEAFCREIAGCVRKQCHVSGEERKN
ncbi:hypothetical protein [uncultured Paludibaculum sp.]|uniref:hypothetical protein n=1 Tax=uncultured Paludibaculum sp. TaxID=1765020 RepID=UPI002AAC4C1D|nr:hypothetical protein [uncultured Paludibaculum sp.]